MKKSILLLLVLSSGLAFAKGKAMKINYSSYGASVLTTSVKDNRVMLDGAPLLMSGVGLAYERAIFTQLTVGPYVSLFKLTSDQEKTNDIAFKSDVRMYGVRARYFISEEADQNGVYLMAGVGAVDIKTTAAYSSISNSASSTSLGGVGGAGFQFVTPDVGMGKWAFNLGATYANGYGVQNQAKIMVYNNSAEVDAPKALGTVFFEGNIAFLF